MTLFTPSKIYVAGPMRGIPWFNEPEFRRVTEGLVAEGFTVFNPMQKDIDMYGEGIYNSPTGDLRDIEHFGFKLRETLLMDITWIANCADQICTLDGWENSSGAKAEVAFATATGIPVQDWRWFKSETRLWAPQGG